MKLLWKMKLDNQPRQMHSLFPPLIAGNVTTSVGNQGDRRRRRRLGQRLRHRRRDGHAALDAALRQHLQGAAADRPRRRQRALPGRPDRDAGPRPDDRPASTSPTPCRGTAGCASSMWRPVKRSSRRAVRAAQRQAVRPEPRQRGDLHRRPRRAAAAIPTTSTRSIWRRRRSATGPPAAAACGRAPVRRSARTARSTPAAATATTTRSSRSTARR